MHTQIANSFGIPLARHKRSGVTTCRNRAVVVASAAAANTATARSMVAHNARGFTKTLCHWKGQVSMAVSGIKLRKSATERFDEKALK